MDRNRKLLEQVVEILEGKYHANFDWRGVSSQTAETAKRLADLINERMLQSQFDGSYDESAIDYVDAMLDSDDVEDTDMEILHSDSQDVVVLAQSLLPVLDSIQDVISGSESMDDLLESIDTWGDRMPEEEWYPLGYWD